MPVKEKGKLALNFIWITHLVRFAETRLYDSLGSMGHKLCGNDTFLDRYGTKISSSRCPVVLSTETPFLQEGYSLWVCGDYVADCIFPTVLSRHFAFFFQTVQSLEQFHPQLFADVFKMKARCKLQVWKSAEEARLLRAKFQTYFAPDRRLRGPVARSS